MAPFISYSLGVIAVLAMTHGLRAQGLPGQWHKVLLPYAASSNTNTLDFAFKDSLNGLCVSHSGEISSTTDGGHTWVLDENSNFTLGWNETYSLFVEAENNVECTAPHRGFFFNGTQTISISPSGAVSLDNATPPGIITDSSDSYRGLYSTLAEKMYDTSYGFRLVSVDTHKSEGLIYPDTAVLMVLVTHDGWHSSSVYGGKHLVLFSSFYSFYPSVNTGIIVDSNDLWAEEDLPIYGSKPLPSEDLKFLLHTSNGGISWDTIDAFDSSLNQFGTGVMDLFANANTKDVFCMLNGSKLDYAYSSDYGKAWRLDSNFSTAGGVDTTFLNVWLMVNSSPGILWAMLGEGGALSAPPYPPSDVMGNNSNRYSRMVAYSSDNGASWAIDSTTFRDDSLEEMHWLDARYGWIASWSHDSLWMWYYDADGTSSVVSNNVPQINTISIVPNPATKSITVDGTLGDVEISDALGRIWQCPRNGNEYNIAALPSGIYFVSSRSERTRFVKE
ncbi:MAG TPA: T9SS type A sorting domain-containing protein [Candidatus Kapabacteria bacterium]|nr:T9SS type A sorting domain-containing protein [Candidatus Kapabacteria bacterium]